MSEYKQCEGKTVSGERCTKKGVIHGLCIGHYKQSAFSKGFKRHESVTRIFTCPLCREKKPLALRTDSGRCRMCEGNGTDGSWTKLLKGDETHG